MNKTQRSPDGVFKAKVGLEAVQGEKTMGKLVALSMKGRWAPILSRVF